MKKQIAIPIVNQAEKAHGTPPARLTAAMTEKTAQTCLAHDTDQADEPESPGFSVFTDDEGRLGIVFEKDAGLGQDLFLEAYAAVQKLHTEILQNERQLELKIVTEEPEANHWWPTEVTCSSCGEIVRLEDDPDSYVIFCKNCDGVILLEHHA